MPKLQPTLLRTDEIDALIDTLPDDHTAAHVQGKRNINLMARRAAARSYPGGGLHARYHLTGGLVIEASYARPKGFSLMTTVKHRLKPGWTIEEAIRSGNAVYVKAMRLSYLDAARADLMRRFDAAPLTIREEGEAYGTEMGLITLYDDMDIDIIQTWHDWLTRRGVPEYPEVTKEKPTNA